MFSYTMRPSCPLTCYTGTIKYQKAFGKTGVDDAARPMELDSVVWIASCTKVGMVLFHCFAMESIFVLWILTNDL